MIHVTISCTLRPDELCVRASLVTHIHQTVILDKRGNSTVAPPFSILWYFFNSHRLRSSSFQATANGSAQQVASPMLHEL